MQGTAADIIKRAMIRLPAALVMAGLDADMLLQVHDELIFEVPEESAEAAVTLITGVMERVPRVRGRLRWRTESPVLLCKPTSAPPSRIRVIASTSPALVVACNG